MKSLFFLILLTSISGCVGLHTITQATHKSKFPNMPYANGIWHSWKEIEHPENGSVTLKTERRWCGVTLWAIVPVPLILPACRSYTKLVFENNKPAMLIEGWTDQFFVGCGPGVFFASQISNGKEESFCVVAIN